VLFYFWFSSLANNPTLGDTLQEINLLIGRAERHMALTGDNKTWVSEEEMETLCRNGAKLRIAKQIGGSYSIVLTYRDLEFVSVIPFPALFRQIPQLRRLH